MERMGEILNLYPQTFIENKNIEKKPFNIVHAWM
jgi:hypothetical protein